PAAGRMEVAFSPNAGAESLVIKVIDSAQRGGSVKLMAYNFTSAPVAQALVRAQHRGAKVQAVVDFKSNVTEDKFGKA
ncbi:phospholipase D family protein, partial [Acinetobacter baumannii]